MRAGRQDDRCMRCAALLAVRRDQAGRLVSFGLSR
jgi:hypothetical protein